ncbi:MAG: PAS domain S-box protein [Bacteroidetes bacterium]|nr:PAS domain S-box protein [Bacteroidota bacterium]
MMGLMSGKQQNKTVVAISIFAIAVSLVVMVGWVCNITVLKQVVPGFVPMVFNTALCFILFGAALLVTQYSKTSFGRAVFLSLSLAGTLIGLLTLLEFLFGFNAGIDQLFVKDNQQISADHLYSGRMAYNAAICFTLLGAGFLLLALRKRLSDLIAQALFLVVCILTAIALIGYLYGVSLFNTLLYVSSMAPHTAILFFLLAVGASLLNPQLGMASLFTGKQIGNKMARRLFGLIVVTAVVFGTVRLQTQHYGFFTNEIDVSLLVVCFLLVSLAIIWSTANWLNAIELKRAQAEEQVKLMNAELEKRVDERTREVHESEEKYHSLIEQASDAIYVLDTNMNFTDVNASMCTMMGYSREELLSMNVEDIIDPEELKTDPLLNAAENPHINIFRERTFMRKDRSVFTAEINVKLFPGKMVMVMARDISERKRIEAERREAELKFRTLAEKSLVGVYISQNERFSYVNPKFAEIFGYEPGELIDTEHSAIEIIISEEYLPIARANIMARHRGEIEIAHYEVKGKKKDGTDNWVEFYGNRVVIGGEPAIIGTMLDITERREAENMVLKEKMLSDTIINSLPGIFYLITDQGKQVRWNINFETLTGYTSAEIEYLTPYDLIAPEDHTKVHDAIEQVFEEGYAAVEASVRAKNGTKTPLLLTGTPILYEGQRCLLGMGIDISSRVKAEEELRASEQKYKFLFESNPLPLWMIARNDLSIIAVNEAAAKLYGYERDELLGKSVRMLRPADDQERNLAGSPLTSFSQSHEIGIIRHLKKDGSPMYVHIIAHDIVFEGREVRLSFTNDVTERLRAEESLQKSQANLQTILETTDIAYALFDTDLKVLEFNQKAIEFVQSQYRHTPQKGDRLADYFPPARFPQFLNFAKEVLQGRHISYEVDYPRRDGSAFWFDVRLSPIMSDSKEILGMLMALYDITERKNTEQDLKSAYQRIQNHVESIKDMAWKQSHLVRSPVANLKALADLLRSHPADTETLQHFQAELNRLDAIIHEMAREASGHVM